MIKKVLITLLLFTSLAGTGFWVQPAFAQGTPPPSGDVASEEFMFDLGAITHKDIEKQNWIRKGINFIFERAITIMAATVGAVAILMMAIGGIRILMSAGRQEGYDKGKAMIWMAVKGLVFVLGAYILVATIQILIKSIFQTG